MRTSYVIKYEHTVDLRFARSVVTIPMEVFEEYGPYIHSIVNVANVQSFDILDPEIVEGLVGDKVRLEVVEKIRSYAENERVMEALDVVKGLDLLSTIKVFQKAALISAVDGITAFIQYQYKLVDDFIKVRRYSFIRVERKTIVIGLLEGGVMVFKNDKSMRVQESNGLTVLLSSAKHGFNPDKKQLRRVASVITDFSSNNLTYSDFIYLLEIQIPILREGNPDYLYMANDILAVLPRELVSANWLIHRLMDVIKDTATEVMVVVDHSGASEGMYEVISRQLFLQGYEIEIIMAHDNINPADYSDMISLLLQCPFSTIYGSNYVSNQKAHDKIDDYQKRIRGKFLMGHYKEWECYFTFKCAQYDQMVVPITRQGDSYLMLNSEEMEPFGVYFVTPHRLRQLYVQGVSSYIRSDITDETGDITLMLTQKLNFSVNRVLRGLDEKDKQEFLGLVTHPVVHRKTRKRDDNIFLNIDFYPTRVQPTPLYKGITCALALNALLLMAAKGEMKYKFTYSDFPERYMSRAEEIVNYGLTKRYIRIDSYGQDKNVYELMIPTRLTAKKTPLPRGFRGKDPIDFDPGKIVVDDSGMVIGDLSLKNPEVSKVHNLTEWVKPRANSFLKGGPLVTLFKSRYRYAKTPLVSNAEIGDDEIERYIMSKASVILCTDMGLVSNAKEERGFIIPIYRMRSIIKALVRRGVLTSVVNGNDQFYVKTMRE